MSKKRSKSYSKVVPRLTGLKSWHTYQLVPKESLNTWPGRCRGNIGVAEKFRAPFVQAALFLALCMLTDPPTSPSRYRDQVWVGALAAATACAAQLLGL